MHKYRVLCNLALRPITGLPKANDNEPVISMEKGNLSNKLSSDTLVIFHLTKQQGMN